jgi:hypothetical protein
VDADCGPRPTCGAWSGSVAWPRALPGYAKPVLVLLVALGALALRGSAPDSAEAAPCPLPTYGLASDVLSIQGTFPCSEESEGFSVYCAAGAVQFEYEVNGVALGSTDTAVGCGSPRRLSVDGNAGDDTIDLSRVSAGNGFTGIDEPNLVEGGYGRDVLVGGQMPGELLGGPQSDIVLARNGVRDTVDCGEGTDAVQTDQAGVDTLSNCELIDLLPTPALATPTATSVETPTGKRAAAQGRCRKLKRRSARRRCFRHAKALPV